jgi:predicted DsbA family dithiol-disulfide isomerase
VAVLRYQRLVDEGAVVEFAGIDVLGLELAIPVTLDQLEGIDGSRAAALELGLVLRRPSRRPPTLAAHLVGEVATDQGVGASWRERCLRAYWEEDADLGEDEVLRELAGDAGVRPDDVAEALADRARRTRLRQRMLVTRGRGVGGVPVLEVVGGTFVPADLPDDDLRRLAAL